MNKLFTQNYCASDCKNYDCKKMLSNSICRAFESSGIDIGNHYSNMSADCDDYRAVELIENKQ